jgi:hypothetical protein
MELHSASALLDIETMLLALRAACERRSARDRKSAHHEQIGNLRVAVVRWNRHASASMGITG